MDAIQTFIGLTSNRLISPLVKDKLILKGDDSRCFTIKAYFDYMEGPSPSLVSIQNAMEPLCPLKNCFFILFYFFAWEAWWGRVFTLT